MLGAWAGDRYGYACWLERVDCLEVDWMENQLDVIVRRLSEVPSVKGNVRTANTGPLDGPGMEVAEGAGFYQKQNGSRDWLNVGRSTVAWWS